MEESNKNLKRNFFIVFAFVFVLLLVLLLFLYFGYGTGDSGFYPSSDRDLGDIFSVVSSVFGRDSGVLSDILPVACTDSDGGRNTRDKGVTCPAGSGEELEGCSVDSCVDYSMLNEYYCDGREIRLEEVNCQFLCGDGSCIDIQDSLYLHRKADDFAQGYGFIIELEENPVRELSIEFSEECIDTIYDTSYTEEDLFVFEAGEVDEVCDFNIISEESRSWGRNGGRSDFIEGCLDVRVPSGAFQQQTQMEVKLVRVTGCQIPFYNLIDPDSQIDTESHDEYFQSKSDTLFGFFENIEDNCGNGIGEVFEECDIGLDNDDYGNICTYSCTIPVCGDSLINQNPGTEECDGLEFLNGDGEILHRPSCGDLYGSAAGNPDGNVYCLVEQSCIVDNLECNL